MATFTDLPGLQRLSPGKVRELYAVGTDRLLLVATDRISAFDVVLPTPIPDKGRVLTGMTAFWLDLLADVVPNHRLSTDPADFPPAVAEHAAALRGRAMLCRRAVVVPVECVARGYLSGSGWKEYREHGTVCGLRLPAGLRESDRLPEPIFTPATKAATGHDENISFDRMVGLVGGDTAERLRDLTLRLYARAAAHAATVGILLADTKFEFGFAEDELLLIDEVLTPDSSRYWPAAGYAAGGPQPSYDKQYVRDWLEAVGFDKTPPGPVIPADVVARTRARYVAAYEQLTGQPFEKWNG